MTARQWVWALAAGALLGLGAAGAQTGGTENSQMTAPAAPSSGASSSTSNEAVQARGRSLVQLFYAVKVEQVWASFTPELQAGWNGLAAFRAYREEGVRVYGAETKVLGERVFNRDGLHYYVRTATFQGDPAHQWLVVFGFDGAGRTAVFTIVPAGDEQQDDVQTRQLSRLTG